MSKLIFIDSFDHYSDAQATRKWTSWGGFIDAGGRTGKGVLRGGHTLIKTFNATYLTLTAGAAFKFNTAFVDYPFRFYQDNAPIARTVDFQTSHNGDGRLFLQWRLVGYPTPGVSSTVVSGLTTYVLSLNQWYYIEVQAAMTTGATTSHLEARLRVNGVEVLSWSTDLNQPAIPFNQLQTKVTGMTDDLYVTDTEFLGDVKIGVLYPNAVGDSSAWTPLSGANWAQVEEHPADDDTSYVSAGSVGLKDLYNLDNIDPAFTGTIKGVQSLLCVKKSDEGEGAVKGLWKSGATEITQADGHNYLAPNGFYPSATEYLYNIQTERVSLFTAVDWTAAEINALQTGITRTL